jgi:hypothetical protein
VSMMSKEERWAQVQDPFKGTAVDSSAEVDAMANAGITHRDMAPVYFSKDPYHDAFDEQLDMRRYTAYAKPAGGMVFEATDDRLVLKHIVPSSPAAKIPAWRTRIRGAWLRQVGDDVVTTEDEVISALGKCGTSGADSCRLVFSHPEVSHGLTGAGIPQVNLDQLNPRGMLRPTFCSATMVGTTNGAFQPDRPHNGLISVTDSGGVLNYKSRAMKLTRGKLLRGDAWNEWHKSEWKQLDQYDEQGMFGDPVRLANKDTTFRLVWTYREKVLDKRKKARCACDGSPQAGQARILGPTYAGCIDHTTSRMFYALAAAEGMQIFGADVTNAFGDAPPPAQGMHILPDKAFNEWWTSCKGRDQIPAGYVVPVLAAMQGHPEAPKLWAKHADKIIKKMELQPVTHEP